MSSVIVNPFISIDSPSYFFVFSVGAFSWAHSNASIKSSLASPGMTSGMKDFIWVILRGSASVGLKSAIWSFVKGIDAKAVFSWRE